MWEITKREETKGSHSYLPLEVSLVFEVSFFFFLQTNTELCMIVKWK